MAPSWHLFQKMVNLIVIANDLFHARELENM